MTRDEEHGPRGGDPVPLSRPVNVERMRPGRNAFTVEASPQECAALAEDFGVDAIRDLVGRFEVEGPTSRLRVTGRVEGFVTQPCSVSLEPFEAPISEPVDVVFSDEVGAEDEAGDGEAPLDSQAADPIVNGRIDLGSLTAEFLALGIDPYPRKPGIAFEEAAGDEADKPFAALGKLRPEAE